MSMPQHGVLPDFVNERVAGFYRRRTDEAWDGRHAAWQERSPSPGEIALTGNDYLDLATHAEVIETQCRVLRGVARGWIRPGGAAWQDEAPRRALENTLAKDLGAQAAIFCQSGYVANVGLIQSIADESTPVYVDMLAHMSLWEGARSAMAVAVPFRHNDLDHLERQILDHGCGVVAVDAVSSLDGSVCPLEAVLRIAERHGCVLVVNESDCLGTHGAHGEGLVHGLGLSERVPFRTASLAKAYCMRAGLIICPAAFKTYFECESRPAAFSAQLWPHELAGIGAMHRVVREEDGRRMRLAHVTKELREGLAELGYPLGGSEQIVALELGMEQRAMEVRDVLEAYGVFGRICRAPSVQEPRALVKFALHAGLGDATVGRLIDIFGHVADRLKPHTWGRSLHESEERRG